MRLNNLKRYKTEQAHYGRVFYLQDDEGNDWYASYDKFEQDTLKVMFDAQGVIRSFDTDVTILNPEGFSVAEVPAAEVPEEFYKGGEWVFDGGKISARVLPPEELQALAAAKKQQLMTQALVAMLPLQNAVKLKMATDAETTALSAWEKYSVLLSRVVLEKPEWPERPTE